MLSTRKDSNTSALYKKILAANYTPPSFITDSVKDCARLAQPFEVLACILRRYLCDNFCKIHLLSSQVQRSPSLLRTACSKKRRLTLLQDLIAGLLTVDPAKRFTIADVRFLEPNQRFEVAVKDHVEW